LVENSLISGILIVETTLAIRYCNHFRTINNILQNLTSSDSKFSIPECYIKIPVKISPTLFQILQEERELYGELKTKHNLNTQHNMIKPNILILFLIEIKSTVG